MKTWYGFPRTPFDVQFVPRNDAAALDAAVDSSTAAGHHRARAGLGGRVRLRAEYMHAVRAACDRAGALLIIDEVQTGMGRLGAPFGAQLYGVRPDLLTVAKGLGGGFPCGALLMPHSIAKDLKAGALGTTFGGGPWRARRSRPSSTSSIATICSRTCATSARRFAATCQLGPSKASKAAASCSA